MSNLAKNPIADLPAKASPASARQGVTKELKTAPQVTGQWLYDRFVTASREDQTKVGLVALAAKSTTTEQWKSALADMVKLAQNTKDEAKIRTARNHQSVLRAVYGALKFAGPEFEKLGYVEGKTGYHEARELAKRALEAKAITWEGYAGRTPEQKAADKAAKVQAKALKEVQDANPQQPGESLRDYMTRLAELTEAKVAEIDANATEERVKALADKVRDLCGDDLAGVISLILQESMPEGDAPPAAAE